ncbi:MAG: hypothetical protein HC889_11790 [Synechococcaceae cyanobacterium SM1_2_3]|nr:hypothetical protein [Synechococcaceae cyanobacterium SM1_2_3]
MPYDWIRLRQWSMGWRIFAISLGWLIFISILHYNFSVERETRRVVRLGYMPVISNLAAPLLDYVSRNQGKVRFEAVKFSSFAELGNALRNDQIDAAFMIAPLSIVLRQQGEEVKVVFIGNRHESTLVPGGYKCHQPESFGGKNRGGSPASFWALSQHPSIDGRSRADGSNQCG